MQVLLEDDSANRMNEALALFKEIVNSKWFVDTEIILLLNKTDLLQEKLRAGANPQAWRADYTGPLGEYFIHRPDLCIQGSIFRILYVEFPTYTALDVVLYICSALRRMSCVI